MRTIIPSIIANIRASRFTLPAVYLAVGGLVGAASVFAFTRIHTDSWPNQTMIRDLNSELDLVKPLLLCTSSYLGEATEYSYLKEAFTSTLDGFTTRGDITQASVYFRNLRTGQWIAVNRDETYWPASMMKVPVMIALYKQAESNAKLLAQTVTVTPDLFPTDPQNIPPDVSLVDGETYTVDELVRRMIVYSDNRALSILIGGMDQDYLKEVLYDLGVDYPTTPGSFEISPHIYSYFFRVLYNATYLNTENSQKALALLTQTTFTNGLVAGFPDSTVIAHKFGDGSFIDDDGAAVAELHDCGIIYNETDDYLLCVMTKGTSPDPLPNVIHDISATVAEALEKSR